MLIHRHQRLRRISIDTTAVPPARYEQTSVIVTTNSALVNVTHPQRLLYGEPMALGVPARIEYAVPDASPQPRGSKGHVCYSLLKT